MTVGCSDLLGPDGHDETSSSAAAPKLRFAALMCNRKNANVPFAEVLHDAVWKPPQRKPTDLPAPRRTESGLLTEKYRRALEL
jgi:hypothetical protein